MVAVLDLWRESGEWWEMAPEVWVWRVQGENQGVYELARHPAPDQWWIDRIYD